MGTCGLLGQIYEVNSHFWEVSCHQQPGDRDELEAVGLPAPCCAPGKGAGSEATPHHEGALQRLAPELCVGGRGRQGLTRTQPEVNSEDRLKWRAQFSARHRQVFSCHRPG